MYGAVVIEPRDLPEVDRSYLLVQSELYLGDQASLVDLDKLAAEEPDAVVFNGHANQYAAEPLPARVGEQASGCSQPGPTGGRRSGRGARGLFDVGGKD